MRSMATNGLTVFWVVVGEKMLIGGKDTYTGKYPGRLIISGFALLDDDGILVEHDSRFEKPK